MAMGRSLRRAWVPVVGACGLLLGCEHSHVTRYPPDPLLLSKKPVESRHAPPALPTLARHEPQAPERLATALASADTEVGSPEAAPRLGPAVPTSLHDDADER
jgi:hypothetical protein